MGVKAVKRAKKQQELDVQNIKKGIPEIKGRVAILENDMNAVRNTVNRAEAENVRNKYGIRRLNNRVDTYVHFFAWLTIFIVAVCGYNFGYVFYQLFIK